MSQGKIKRERKKKKTARKTYLLWVDNSPYDREERAIDHPDEAAHGLESPLFVPLLGKDGYGIRLDPWQVYRRENPGRDFG